MTIANSLPITGKAQLLWLKLYSLDLSLKIAELLCWIKVKGNGICTDSGLKSETNVVKGWPVGNHQMIDIGLHQVTQENYFLC